MNPPARQLIARQRTHYPRVLAQHVATGEIFEITRGETLCLNSYAALVADFGPTWITWTEYHPRQPRNLSRSLNLSLSLSENGPALTAEDVAA